MSGLNDLFKQVASDAKKLEEENILAEKSAEKVTSVQTVTEQDNIVANAGRDKDNTGNASSDLEDDVNSTASTSSVLEQIANGFSQVDKKLSEESKQEDNTANESVENDDFSALDNIGSGTFVAPTARQSEQNEKVDAKESNKTTAFNDSVNQVSKDADASQKTDSSFLNVPLPDFPSTQKTTSTAAVSSLPEAQEFFSAEGILPNSNKAEAARAKLELQKEVAAILGNTGDAMAQKANPEEVEVAKVKDKEEIDERPLNPFFSVLIGAAEGMSRLGSGLAQIASLPQEKLDEYQSREQRYARYTAKSTKAQKQAINLSNDMIIKADAFKRSCKEAGIQPHHLSKDNMDVITAELGGMGEQVRRSYEALTDAVVDHELALVELDTLTAKALKDETIGLNTLARQNENVRRYQQNMERVSEAFTDVPLFGAKAKLDSHKTMTERLEAFREWMRSPGANLGDLMKDIANRLRSMLTAVTAFISDKVKTQRVTEEPTYALPVPTTP